MAFENNEIVNYTLGAAGAGFSAVFGFRKLVKMWAADNTDIANEKANEATVTRLQGEINRLESLVTKMQERLETMDSRLTRMKQLLIDVQVELIDVETEVAKCACSNVSAVRMKLAEARKKILEVDL